jgi:7-cyano-7-deazaguanine synthase
MAKQPVIMLLSGGLDSTVSLATLMEDPHYEVLRCISFNYGQRAWAKEHQAMVAIAHHYSLPLQVIELGWLRHLVPEGYSQGFQGVATHLSDVWVPNRNGVMLNIAASIAEALGAGLIAFGANLDEAEAGFPDNGENYWFALNKSLHYSTMGHVRVWPPVGDLRKVDIVRRGVRLNAPLHLIWSCYGDDEAHCGKCSSCQHLQNGLRGLGEGVETGIRFMDQDALPYGTA